MTRDDADRKKDGDLAADPFEGTERMNRPSDETVAALQRERDGLARRLNTLDDLLGTAKEPAEVLDETAPTVGTFAAESLEHMARRSYGVEQPLRLPWPTVADKVGGGLWPGMYVLVGNTGAGKSQWALQVALNAALDGTPVLYLGLELGKDDLAARLLGMLSGERWSNLWQGKCDGDTLQAIRGKHLAALIDLPFHQVMAPPYGWPYSQLYSLSEGMRDRYRAVLLDDTGKPQRPFLVVVDFLQIVASAPGDREDLRQRIQQAAYAARAVARDMGAVVLLVSGTARENYARLSGFTGDNKKTWEQPPHYVVGAGKESGEVEYAADGVLVLVQEPWLDNTPPPEGTHIHLAVAKLRAGVEGWIDLRFNGAEFSEPAHGTARR